MIELFIGFLVLYLVILASLLHSYYKYLEEGKQIPILGSFILIVIPFVLIHIILSWLSFQSRSRSGRTGFIAFVERLLGLFLSGLPFLALIKEQVVWSIFKALKVEMKIFF